MEQREYIFSKAVSSLKDLKNMSDFDYAVKLFEICYQKTDIDDVNKLPVCIILPEFYIKFETYFR